MKCKNVLAMAGLATVLTVGIPSAFAQGGGGGGGGGGGFGGGNFDPAQMQQMMLDRTRQTLGVTEDADWKALEPKVTAVMEARRAVPNAMGMGMGGGRRGGANAGADQTQQRPRNPMMGTPSPALEALQKAIEAKAPAAELKSKMDAYRAEVKTKQAALEKAQDDLRKLLSTEQEAKGVASGLLN